MVKPQPPLPITCLSFHSKKPLHLTVGTGISDAVSTAVLEECLYTEVLYTPEIAERLSVTLH